MCVQYVCLTGFGDDYSYSIDNILKYRKILAIDNIEYRIDLENLEIHRSIQIIEKLKVK